MARSLDRLKAIEVESVGEHGGKVDRRRDNVDVAREVGRDTIALTGNLVAELRMREDVILGPEQVLSLRDRDV
jgi:hypothetical protein